MGMEESGVNCCYYFFLCLMEEKGVSSDVEKLFFLLGGGLDNETISILEGVRVVVGVEIESNVAGVADGGRRVAGEGLEERKRNVVSDGAEGLSSLVTDHIVQFLVFEDLGEGRDGDIVSELTQDVGELVVKEGRTSSERVADGERSLGRVDVTEREESLVALEDAKLLVEKLSAELGDGLLLLHVRRGIDAHEDLGVLEILMLLLPVDEIDGHLAGFGDLLDGIVLVLLEQRKNRGIAQRAKGLTSLVTNHRVQRRVLQSSAKMRNRLLQLELTQAIGDFVSQKRARIRKRYNSPQRSVLIFFTSELHNQPHF